MGSKRILVPVELGGIGSPFPPEHLWPLGADADRAAAALVAGLALPGEKTQQSARQQLEAAQSRLADAAQFGPQPYLAKIQLVVKLNPKMVFIDIVSWDLNTPLSMCEVHASRVAQDLKLAAVDAMRIAGTLRKLVEQARASAAAGQRPPEEPPSPEGIARPSQGMPPWLLTPADADKFLRAQQARAAERKGRPRTPPPEAAAPSAGGRGAPVAGAEVRNSDVSAVPSP